MSSKKHLLLLTLLLVVSSATLLWPQGYPVHTRLLFEDELQSAGVKSYGEVVNGNMDNKWTPGNFIAGQGWQTANKFSQLRVKFNEYLPFEGTLEFKVRNFYPPGQLDESSVSPVSMWSRSACNMVPLEPTPASFWYLKTEKKFLSGATAKLLLRLHPSWYKDNAGLSQQDVETAYLTWDANKEYTFKFVWTATDVWLIIDGVVAAHKAPVGSDYFKESYNFLCFGNSTWDGMTGPVYRDMKIYAPATTTPFSDISKSTRIDINQLVGVQGVCVSDINNDGLMDVYYAFAQDASSLKSNLLFVQTSDGSFQDQTNARGLGDVGYWSASGFADIDGDGDMDLIQGCRTASPRLYINSNGIFSDQASLRGLTGAGRDAKTVLPIDLENDGDVDIVIIDGSAAHEVYVNRGTGIFDASPRGLNVTGSVAGAVAGDFNGDRYTDIFVTRRDNPCAMYINNGSGSFTEQAAGRGINFSGRCNTPTVADYDNDGDLDIFIGMRGTSEDKSPLNGVFENTGTGNFTNRSTAVNILIDTYALYPGDLNNDGYVDLYAPRFDRILGQAPTSRIYQNTGSRTFIELDDTGAEMLYMDNRGAAVFDYNNDGLLDLLGSAKGKIEPNSSLPYGRSALLKNEMAKTNHYIQIAVLDRSGKLNGLGAKIWIYRAGQYEISSGLLGFRQVFPNQGYQSQSGYVQHFGLADQSSVDIKVQTPDGKVYSYLNIQADRLFNVSPSALKPKAIFKISGDNQTGIVNSFLADSIKVRVTDIDDKNLSGMPVNFTITTGNGSLNGGAPVQQVYTDANGIARIAWKLGTASGYNNNTLSVSCSKDDGTAITNSPLLFVASAGAGPAAAMTKISGDNQQNYAFQTLALPLVVQVVDAFANPVVSYAVTFDVAVGGGSLNETGSGHLEIMTDSQGQAQTIWKLGSLVGTQRVQAYSSFNSNSPQVFQATALEPQRRLLMQSGNYQSGVVNQTLSQPLVVKLQDYHGNNVANETVRFTVLSGGGKFNGQTIRDVTTDLNGLASVTPTLGTVKGDSNNVFQAEFNGAQGSPLIFKASAAAGAAAKLIEVSLNNQTGVVNRLLAHPFTVRVLDAFSNPIAGHPVDYAVMSGGGTLNGQATQKPITDANGYAAVTLKLGTLVGANTVKVSSGALQGSPITFSATAQAGTPSKFLEISGNKQRGVFNQTLPYPFVVAVTDSFANPIGDHPVQFTVTRGNGSMGGQGLVSVATNSVGRAAVTLTLGSSGYANEVTATTQYNNVPLGSAIVFTATTAAGDPDSLVYVSGNHQIGRINNPLPQPLKVMVVDAQGAPISNFTVVFLAVLSGTSFNGAQTLEVKTDANGIAGATPTIGSSFGKDNYVFQARAYYKEILLRNAPLEFFASGRRSTATKLTYVSGNNQVGIVGRLLPDSLRVRVTDDQNTAIAGHPVSFEVVQGNAAINGAATTYAALSNGAGLAAIALKMGSQPTSARVRVSADDGLAPLTGSPLYFEAAAVIGPASAIKSTRTVVTPVVADGIQNSKVTVLLQDAEGNPVPNKVVQIFAQGIGVQVKQPDKATDQNGLAQGWLSSIRTGMVKVWTMVDGELMPADTSVVSFVAGPPTEASPFGSGQMGLRKTVLPMPLGVMLYDANGNPVSDVTVTFTILTGGGSVQPSAAVKTDAQGRAAVQWLLGPQVDTQTMQAVVAGMAGSPIVYSAIATPPNPGSMQMVSGDRQIGVFNQTLSDSFKVMVRDSSGNAAEGLQVYFHFTGQGQAVSANPVRTDRRGMAALLYRPFGPVMGEFTVTATAPGLSQSVEFHFIVQNEWTILLKKVQEIKTGYRPREVVELVVQAVDAYQRPLNNHLLNFEITAGLGSLQGNLPAATDVNGFARINWQLGLIPNQTVRVSSIQVKAEPLTFTTTAVNSKPKLTVPADMTTLPGQTITQTIVAYDADGDAVTIGARRLPAAALFDSTGSNIFLWTPSTLHSGASYDILFIATDAYSAADTAQWRITVETINRAPRIVSLTPPDTLLEKYFGETILFDVQAYDPDNNNLSYFWRVNNAFAGNQKELPIEADSLYFPEHTLVQVEVSDGTASTVVRWHLNLSPRPAAVRLSNLQAQCVGHKAELIWQTSSEVDNLGFKILRATSAQGPFEIVSETLIPTSASGYYHWADESVQSGTTYYYKLRDLDRNGKSNDHGPVSIVIALPEVLALTQNYPNPFNPTTTIAFELPKSQSVQLFLYNLNGQKVATLADGAFAAGVHQVVWDGRDEQGRQVTSGIYYYVLQTAESRIMKKLLLTK